MYRWPFSATVVILDAGRAVSGTNPGFSDAEPALVWVQISLQKHAMIVVILVVARLSADQKPGPGSAHG